MQLSQFLVLSVDEKSQIQTLDDTQPGLSLKKGRGQTMTHERHDHFVRRAEHRQWESLRKWGEKDFFPLSSAGQLEIKLCGELGHRNSLSCLDTSV